MNAQGAAFDEIERAVQRPLFHQHLAAVQGKRLHVAGQDVPMRLIELAAQGVAGVAMRDGLRQALDVKTDGGGEWGVHSGRDDTFALYSRQGSLTLTYT